MTRIELNGHDIAGIRAANAGPFTLSGTNTWIIGRDPAWLIDPGPAMVEHVESIGSEIDRRGGLAGIALTHDHSDHSEAVPTIRARFPEAKLAGARGDVDLALAQGREFGPLVAIETPGHAPDHLAFITGPVAFTGDAVLGEGSVFISPDPGALAGYLAGLQRLRGRELSVLAPGHGPPVPDVEAKLEQYIAHRLDRERRLIAALASRCSHRAGATRRRLGRRPGRAQAGGRGDARGPPRQARGRGPVARRGAAAGAEVVSAAISSDEFRRRSRSHRRDPDSVRATAV